MRYLVTRSEITLRQMKLVSLQRCVTMQQNFMCIWKQPDHNGNQPVYDSNILDLCIVYDFPTGRTFLWSKLSWQEKVRIKEKWEENFPSYPNWQNTQHNYGLIFNCLKVGDFSSTDVMYPPHMGPNAASKWCKTGLVLANRLSSLNSTPVKKKNESREKLSDKYWTCDFDHSDSFFLLS